MGKRLATKKNLVHIYTAIAKPHGNSKPKNYNRYTHEKEKATREKKTVKEREILTKFVQGL